MGVLGSDSRLFFRQNLSREPNNDIINRRLTRLRSHPSLLPSSKSRGRIIVVVFERPL